MNQDYPTLTGSQRPIFGGHMQRGLAWAVPTFTTFLFVLLSIIPFSMLGLGSVVPAFSLIAVYFWSVNRPQHLPMGLLFLLGISQDFLWGNPIGLWTMGFLLMSILTQIVQAPFRIQGVSVHWIGFAFVFAQAALFVWLIACMYYGRFLNPGPLMAQVLVTVAVYPLFARVLQAFEARALKLS